MLNNTTLVLEKFTMLAYTKQRKTVEEIAAPFYKVNCLALSFSDFLRQLLYYQD
jgi:hypothetical protein